MMLASKMTLDAVKVIACGAKAEHRGAEVLVAKGTAWIMR
jgi:hypothetical protein